MNDTISRQGAIDAIDKYFGDLMIQGRFDILSIIKQLPTADVPDRKAGEWDMFDLISSAYYGKRMYAKEDNDIVYSRYSCKYMTVDEALREFISLIDDSELSSAERKKGKWIRRELGVSSSGDDEVMVAYYVCSECGHANWIKENNYCPNCGAEMFDKDTNVRSKGEE